jgi:hypothetical protein
LTAFAEIPDPKCELIGAALRAKSRTFTLRLDLQNTKVATIEQMNNYPA